MIERSALATSYVRSQKKEFVPPISLFKTLVKQSAKKEKCREIIWFGPIWKMRSTFQPILCENSASISMIEGRTASSLIEGRFYHTYWAGQEEYSDPVLATGLFVPLQML